MYFLVIVIGVTFIFSQVKPSCKNKLAKGNISCKVNIEANKKINATDEIQLSNTAIPHKLDAKNNSIDKKSCFNCIKTPLWKIWEKKKGCRNTGT